MQIEQRTNGYSVEVSEQEAILLFELLTNTVEADKQMHEADDQVANDLICLLEKQLTTPLQQAYPDVLNAARIAYMTTT